MNRAPFLAQSVLKSSPNTSIYKNSGFRLWSPFHSTHACAPFSKLSFAQTSFTNPCTTTPFQSQLPFISKASTNHTQNDFCPLSIHLSREFHVSVGNFQKKVEKVVPFLLADIGEGITECEITQWFVKPGDKVSQFEKICEVQSDKAVVEISSRYDGIIKTLHFKVNDIAKVGKPLVDILTLENATEEATSMNDLETVNPISSPSDPNISPETSIPSPDSNSILAAPAVRRIAREKGIDLGKVKGTGVKGRISKEDLDAFLLGTPSSSSPVSAPIIKEPISTLSVAENPWLPLSMTQKAMIKSMTQSLQIPHFVYTDEIRMDSLVQAKKTLSSLGAHPKLTYLPFLIKSCSLALLQYPSLNAKFSDTHYQHQDAHHIGVAVDTAQGLLVPKVPHVERQSIISIASSLLEIQDLARQNKLTPIHFQSTSLTLSNIGAIGGDYMHPVIPAGQVCIIATGKIRAVPRCVYDQSLKQYVTEIHHVMPVSISADHRYIDGATVARFVVAWKHFLENPMIMLTQLK